jgi:hypothetical protein
MVGVVRLSGTIHSDQTATGIGPMMSDMIACRSCRGHDHDPQRLDASVAPFEVSGVDGRHSHGWSLVLQALRHEIRPSTAQHIPRLPLIDSFVRDHQHCRVKHRQPSHSLT